MRFEKAGIVSGIIAVLFMCMPTLSFAEGESEGDVRAYFSDLPVMIAIAKCESNFTQLGTGGTPLYGGMAGKMVGIFQIYEDIHGAYARDRGMDILTSEGNLAYARHLYEREGTAPWNSSKSCWMNNVESNPTTSAGSVASASLTIDLGMGTVHPQVVTLQKMLNARGFPIATEGPGSPSNETNRYGSLTQAAVKKFQCAQSIVCTGDGNSTGYGFVGPRTRAALLAQGSGAVAVPSPQSTSTNHDADAEIARLQAQIAELTQRLAELTRGL